MENTREQGGSPDAKKLKSVGPSAKTPSEFLKGLIHRGASLQKEKVVVLANLCATEGSTVLAVHRIRHGGVGKMLYLAPKEWENLDIEYNDKGEMVSVSNGKEVLRNDQLVPVATSWNAYKKYDALMVLFDKNKKIIGCVPRASTVEKSVDVTIDQQKKEVRAWRVMFLTETRTYFTSPTTLEAFLKLDIVGVECFAEVASSVEETVVAGKFEQLDAANFDSPEKLAQIVSDTSIFSKKRDLAALLLGYTWRDGSMEEKIKAFATAPSVAFAAAAGFLQVQSADLVNTTTRSDVKKVLIQSLKDDDLIVMNRVTISEDYWRKIHDVDTLYVYKGTGSLAIKKKGKQQTSAMKFTLEKASDVLAIHKIIAAANTRAAACTTEAKTALEDDEIDDDLFG